MRIGNVRIKGITKRFWYFLGGAVGLLFLLVLMISLRPPPPDPLVTPAFDPAALETLEPNWIEPYISEYGLHYVDDQSVLTDYYSANLGFPFRTRVFLPSQDSMERRQDLIINYKGWQFMPAVFLDPTMNFSQDQAATIEQELTSGQPLVVGFPQAAVPAAGQPYEVTGLLYWNSFELRPPDEEASEDHPSSPVILASAARPLSTSELEAPTTHAADLDIVYEQANQQLRIKRMEWSSGRQVRLCVSLTNTGSPRPLTMWRGMSEFRAEYETSYGLGTSSGSIDMNSPLSAQSFLDPRATVTGYIVFNDPPAAAPDRGMTLFVPSLASSYMEVPPAVVDIEPRQFADVTAVDHGSRGDASDGCAAR